MRALLISLWLALAGSGGVYAYSPDAMNTTDNNATLRNIPSTAATYVTRLGYASPGDAPPLVFKSSNAACSLNGGNGDGGSQVKSLDNKCWLAQFQDNSRIDIRQFGAKPFTGTGVPTVADDVASAIMTAWAAKVGRLYAPGSIGVWPLMSAITAQDYPLKIIGDYPQELQGTNACPTGKPAGTWFRISNIAARFLVREGTTQNATMGSELSSFGVCQDHPAPAPGWKPTGFVTGAAGEPVYLPVFTLSATSGCNIDRIYWYGVYDAISVGNSARCTITEQRGQFFHYFWTGDNIQDMTDWHNWHLWPFWSTNANVISYQITNGEMARIGRMDGLHATNIFALQYKEVVHFINSPGGFGPAAGIYFGPLYCDGVLHCVHTDSNAGNTVASLGFVQYGGESVNNSVGFLIEGGSTNLSIATMYCLASYGPCVQVTGPNSFVGIGWPYANDYDTAGLGNNAFRANSTDSAFPTYIALGQYPVGSFTTHGTPVPAIDNTTPNGYVSVGGIITRDYVPALQFGGAGAGIAYATTPSGKIQKNLFTGEVHGSVKLTLTNKGSSTGNAGVTLPAGFTGSTAVGRFERDQMGSQIWHNGFVGSPTTPFVFAPANAAGLQLLQNGTGAFLTDANFAATTSIQFAW